MRFPSRQTRWRTGSKLAPSSIGGGRAAILRSVKAGSLGVLVAMAVLAGVIGGVIGAALGLPGVVIGIVAGVLAVVATSLVEKPRSPS